MSKQKKKKHIWVVTCLLAAVLCFVLLAVQVWVDRNKEVSFRITEGEKKQDVSVWMEVTKSWADYDENRRPCYGAQYDGFVENHMGAVLMNWELRIVLPAEARIDSAWNGEYSLEGNVIVFDPDDTLDIGWVKSGATEGFGFVLYSDQVLDIQEFVVVGHKYAPVVSYPLFYLGILLTIVFVIVLTWQIAFELRTRQMEQRRINDEKIIVETMLTLANFIDAKDEYTQGHSSRVSTYSVKLARRMRMDEEEVRNIGYTALLHDCGKIGIPDHILNKPGVLTPEEREIMEQHTVLGGHLLENMTAVKGIKEGALYHHERYDGGGYPEGLKGEEIPLYARIINVADYFDAMNTDRCYRKRLPMDKIKQELSSNSGKQFDPEIVKHMLNMIAENDLE